jgi:hypothetical protein
MSATIFVNWHSKEDKPLKNIIFDEEPKFNVSLFEYSGSLDPEPTTITIGNGEWEKTVTIYSEATEGKGDIIKYVAQREETYDSDYVGFFDEDILVRVSDLNRALQIAEAENLCSFQPSLAPCSHYTFGFTLHHENSIGRKVGWVESMMPTIKQELLREAKPFLDRDISISFWGIDAYLFPMLAYMHNIGNGHAVIDVAIAAHIREITSGNCTRRNGLTAREEMANMKVACKEHLEQAGIDWEKIDTLRVLFDF